MESCDHDAMMMIVILVTPIVVMVRMVKHRQCDDDGRKGRATHCVTAMHACDRHDDHWLAMRLMVYGSVTIWMAVNVLVV